VVVLGVCQWPGLLVVPWTLVIFKRVTRISEGSKRVKKDAALSLCQPPIHQPRHQQQDQQYINVHQPRVGGVVEVRWKHACRHVGMGSKILVILQDLGLSNNYLLDTRHVVERC
jgi:hypothetical protein